MAVQGGPEGTAVKQAGSRGELPGGAFWLHIPEP